jgi:hypothetical protein
VEGSPFIGKKPVIHAVLNKPVAAKATLDKALELQAYLTEHSLGGGISGRNAGGDIQQAPVIEGVAQDSAQRLGGIATSPIRHADPESGLRADPIRTDLQMHGADHASAVLTLDDERTTVAVVGAFEPVGGISLTQWMRDASGLQRHARVTGEAQVGFEVAALRRTEWQTFGFENRANSSDNGLHEKNGWMGGVERAASVSAQFEPGEPRREGEGQEGEDEGGDVHGGGWFVVGKGVRKLSSPHPGTTS